MMRCLVAILAGALVVTGCGAPETVGQEASAVEMSSPVTDPAVTQTRDVLSTEIDRIALDFGGSVGIAVVDVSDGWSTGFAADTLMPQQSVSKLWVALTALEQVDQGKLQFFDTVRLTRDDLAVFHQPIRPEILRNGTVVKDIEELLERALTESDNTANDAVLNAVGGPDAVRAVLSDKGLTAIRFGPGERIMQSAIAGLAWRQSYAFTGMGFFDARDLVPANEREIAFNSYQSNPVDGARPQAIATALARLARGELLSDASTQWLISTLRRTKSGPNRLKAGVPEGWEIAHKTGTGQYWNGRQSGYNDVALLFAPDGRTYALAVMIGETRRTVPERMQMMQGAVRAVANYHDTLLSL